jgi:hypothetical protein
MKKIVISGAFGAGFSMLKTLTLLKKDFDKTGITCHDAWNEKVRTTINNDSILTSHLYDIDNIVKKFRPNITVWLYINKKNILQICQRIVVLEFIYAVDRMPREPGKNFGWNQLKHNNLAGKDWPKFSTKITDYPTFCLDELCQDAFNRCEIWTRHNSNFDLEIDSDELFGDSPPVTIQNWLSTVGCVLDQDFLNKWQTVQKKLFHDHCHLFTWNPYINDHYITPIPPEPTTGVL